MFKTNNNAARFTARIACVAMLILAVLSLSACMKPQATVTEEDQPVTPSQYMSDVAQVAEELKAELASFNEAVNADDIAAMQTKADSAYVVLDKLESMEVPDTLKDVKDKYVEATGDLKSALNDYIALYTEISDSTDADPFDYDSYADRLESIQKQYDNGLTTLEEADKLAAEK